MLLRILNEENDRIYFNIDQAKVLASKGNRKNLMIGRNIEIELCKVN